MREHSLPLLIIRIRISILKLLIPRCCSAVRFSGGQRGMSDYFRGLGVHRTLACLAETLVSALPNHPTFRVLAGLPLQGGLIIRCGIVEVKRTKLVLPSH